MLIVKLFLVFEELEVFLCIFYVIILKFWWVVGVVIFFLEKMFFFEILEIYFGIRDLYVVLWLIKVVFELEVK